MARIQTDISEQVKTQAKVYAAQSNKTLAQITEEALSEYLARVCSSQPQ